MNKSEKSIETYLIKKVTEIGGVCRKWVCPGRRGVPDRICVFPHNVIYFVECKSATGKLSPLQTIELNTLKALGCNTLVIDSTQKVDSFILSVLRLNNH